MPSSYQKQFKKLTDRQEKLLTQSVERYYGKLALLQEWEAAGIENQYVFQLREKVRKGKIILENKGAL